MAAKIPCVLDSATPEIQELQAGDTIAISLFTNDSGYTTNTGDLLADGSVPLTANWDVGSYKITAQTFESDVATGTAPFTVASQTVVTNLNASLLEGNAASAFATASHNQAWSTITSTPTTLSGYGITDAVSSGGALGTPSSGTLTNCTGLPTAGIVDDAVTYAKIQNVVNDDRVLGRVSGANGVIEELTAAQVHALIKSLVVIPIVGAASDETTDLTTGTAKLTFRMPYAFTLTDVRASVTTAPVGSVLTVDINESGTTILSTKITIDASEKTSETAATAPVISDSSLADDAEITVDIDSVGSSTAGAGLKVYLIGYPT